MITQCYNKELALYFTNLVIFALTAPYAFCVNTYAFDLSIVVFLFCFSFFMLAIGHEMDSIGDYFF